MTTYVFKAIDVSGVPSKGEVAAESKQAVVDQLKARNLIVLDIADKRKSKEISFEFLNRVKANELAITTRQLATMVSSGMTLLRTLYVLEAQTDNKALKDTLVSVRKDIEAGVSLSDAMARHPKIFNHLYIAMVRAGETGGVLEEALMRIADQLEADESLRRKVKSAMMYPAVVTSFALIVLFALVAFLVPVFVGVFKQFGGDLPTITKFTVAISHFVTHQWYLLIAGVVGSSVGFTKWRKS
jgi:type IV pilus assembly protein PilC